MKKIPEEVFFGAINLETEELLDAMRVAEYCQLKPRYDYAGFITPDATFETQVAKAGGRCFKVPSGKTTAADWHEQDPT